MSTGSMRRWNGWNIAPGRAISASTPRICRASSLPRGETTGARRNDPAGSRSSSTGLPTLADGLLRRSDVRRVLLDHAHDLAGRGPVDARALRHRDLRRGPHGLDELSIGAAL